MASAAPLASVDGISSFVSEHSELYKEQKAGDGEATIEGCFPPLEIMPPDRVVQCVSVLARLFQECSAAATHKLPAQRSRIFRVRDSPLHASLEGFDSEEELADLRTVLDYMLLPKSLVEALELEGAVVKARREYQEATTGYILATATNAKPRLTSFMLKVKGLKDAVSAALLKEPDWAGSIADLLNDGCDRVIQSGFLDGLMGESVSEYGYTPGTSRLLAYASGCIMARRPIPEAALVSPSVAERKETEYDFPERVSMRPLALAVQICNLSALEELHAAGWDYRPKLAPLAVSAAAHGLRETLLWLRSLDPEVFQGQRKWLFEPALRGGHIDLAKWIVGESAELGPAFKPGANTSTAANIAAGLNDLELLKWVHDELGVRTSSGVVSFACQHGNREMFDWYFSKAKPDDGCGWMWSALGESLRAGHFDMSFSLLQRGRLTIDISPRVLAVACEGARGKTDIIDALLSVSPPLPWTHGKDEVVRILAAEALHRGSVPLLEWIASRPGTEGWLCDATSAYFREVVENAVQNSHLECVRWLLNRPAKESLAKIRGELIITRVPSYAVLELVAPYYGLSSAYAAAIPAADLSLVRWLNARGYAFPALSYVDSRLLKLLGAGPDSRPQWLSFLVCLAEECDVVLSNLPGVCEHVAKGGSTEAMQLVVAQGAGLSPSVLTEAARHGHLPLCRWLRQQGVEWSGGIVQQAKSAGADEVAAWIEEEQAKERAASKGPEHGAAEPADALTASHAASNAGAGKA